MMQCKWYAASEAWTQTLIDINNDEHHQSWLRGNPVEQSTMGSYY